MPGSGTGTFIDPDDYQARFNHVRIDLLATSPGALKANLTWRSRGPGILDPTQPKNRGSTLVMGTLRPIDIDHYGEIKP
jgi:hypothetical protein